MISYERIERFFSAQAFFLQLEEALCNRRGIGSPQLRRVRF